MQTKNLKKKGFTLVELVVVVAVIAVLSAILIPTIGCFVEQAKETNDMATVRLLNVALVEDEAANGTPVTVTEALAAMDRKGYDIEKLNLRSTGEIYWDGANNRFMLLKGDEVLYGDNTTPESERYNWWKLLKNGDELSTTYSNYLKEGYVVDGGALTISTGLDVGSNKGVTAVYYKGAASAQNVVIRTNSLDTVLYVNAESDEVSHYGEAKEVNIAKVKKGTYNEYGKVLGNINVAYGFVSLKNGASVSNVVVKEVTVGETTVTPANAEDFKVTVDSNANVNMVISDVETIAVPVEGDKAASVPSITKSEEYGAYIGSTPYMNYYKATQAAKDGDTITLMANVTNFLESLTGQNAPTTVTLDLNGYTFTLFDKCEIYKNHKVTIKNGTFIYTGANAVYDPNDTTEKFIKPAIKVDENAGLTLEGVTFTSGSYGISALDNASYIEIKNSTLTASGMAVATNNLESANTKIVVSSSTIKSVKYKYSDADYDDTCAIMLNNSGSMEISNSYIEGGAQGVIVRAGIAHISNSEIKARLGLGCSKDAPTTGIWTNGNNVMQGALIVGDWSNAYNTNSVCELTNTKITSDNESWGRELIVLSQDGSCKTTLTFDAVCAITEYYVHDITTDGLKKGVIEVNGAMVRAAD